METLNANQGANRRTQGTLSLSFRAPGRVNLVCALKKTNLMNFRHAEYG